MVGNGRRAREDGKDEFRFGMILCAGTRFVLEASAKGEETMGRDTDTAAEYRKK